MDASALSLLQQAMAARTGGDASPLPDLRTALAEHPDPAVRMLADLWSRREAEEPEPEPEPMPIALGSIEVPELDAASDAVDPEQWRRLRRLERELEGLREVNAALAAALGACARCWGDDHACHMCGGDGRAGGLRPHPRLFVRLVLPAVRRMSRSGLGPKKASGPAGASPVETAMVAEPATLIERSRR